MCRFGSPPSAAIWKSSKNEGFEMQSEGNKLGNTSQASVLTGSGGEHSSFEPRCCGKAARVGAAVASSARRVARMRQLATGTSAEAARTSSLWHSLHRYRRRCGGWRMGICIVIHELREQGVHCSDRGAAGRLKLDISKFSGPSITRSLLHDRRRRLGSEERALGGGV